MVKKILVIMVCFLSIVMLFYVIFIFLILDYEIEWGKVIYNISLMLLCLKSVMNLVFYIWRLKEL